MGSLVKGMSYVTNHCKETCFTYSYDEGKTFIQEEDHEEFPKILVSIGSGVSIIKIKSYEDYKWVSGTMIGGGTLLGLSNLLIGTTDFAEI